MSKNSYQLEILLSRTYKRSYLFLCLFQWYSMLYQNEAKRKLYKVDVKMYAKILKTSLRARRYIAFDYGYLEVGLARI